jgi:hypothetical protein
MTSQFKPAPARQAQPADGQRSSLPAQPLSGPGRTQGLALVLSWVAVGLPLAWGVAETLRKALALFE